MEGYAISISRFDELKFYIIGKIISYSCFIIGRFMPYYFAGRLESGNVCEYFKMKHFFNSLGITEHDEILYQMAIKEKEHEVYFLEKVKADKWLPFFEKFFLWGRTKSLNNVNLDKKYPVSESDIYCKPDKGKL